MKGGGVWRVLNGVMVCMGMVSSWCENAGEAGLNQSTQPSQQGSGNCI